MFKVQLRFNNNLFLYNSSSVVFVTYAANIFTQAPQLYSSPLQSALAQNHARNCINFQATKLLYTELWYTTPILLSLHPTVVLGLQNSLLLCQFNLNLLPQDFAVVPIYMQHTCCSYFIQVPNFATAVSFQIGNLSLLILFQCGWVTWCSS